MESRAKSKFCSIGHTTAGSENRAEQAWDSERSQGI